MRLRLGFDQASIGFRSGFVDGSFGISLFGNFPVISEFQGSFRHFLLQAEETVGGAMILEVETSFAAAQVFEFLGLLAQGLVGQHGLGGRVFAAVGFGQAVLFVGDADGFHGPGAEDAPASDGHGCDEPVLVRGGRLEFSG